MKLLLDTHILLWVLWNSSRLPQKARELVADENNEIYYSIVSPWEVEIKHAAHPDQMSTTAAEIEAFADEAGFLILPVQREHIGFLPELKRSAGTPEHHDLFDRMLICQAVKENMIFVTHDTLIAGYDSPVILLV